MVAIAAINAITVCTSEMHIRIFGPFKQTMEAVNIVTTASLWGLKVEKILLLNEGTCTWTNLTEAELSSPHFGGLGQMESIIIAVRAF